MSTDIARSVRNKIFVVIRTIRFAIASLFLGAAVCFPLSSSSAQLVAGDVAPLGNPDGILNAADLTVLQRFVLGNLTPDSLELLVCDVAPSGVPDGILNAADVSLVSQAILGLRSLPPIDIGPDAPVLDAVTSPTNDNPELITGTAIANIEVRLYVNGQQQSTTTAASNGSFSFSATLFDGVNSIDATAWDGIDESQPSNVLSLDYVSIESRTISTGNSNTIISSDTVWTPGSPVQPYIVVDSWTLPEGVTLTIQPGTQILFEQATQATVEGTLVARGAVANPILFTSTDPIANWHWATGAWWGIIAYGSETLPSSVVLEHVIVEYANRGMELFVGGTITDSTFQNNLTGLRMDTAGDVLVDNNAFLDNDTGVHVLSQANVTISNNTINYPGSNGVGQGIYLESSSANTTVENNTITQTTSGFVGSGIYIVGVGNPLIQNNVIQGSLNGISVDSGSGSPQIIGNIITSNCYGIYVEAAISWYATPVVNNNSIYDNGATCSGANYWVTEFDNFPDVTLDAKNNWWGSVVTAEIAATILDRSDNLVDSAVVDYSDFLDGEQGSSVPGNYLVGELSADLTLSANTVYDVLGHLSVPAGVTLTVEAGAQLLFAAGLLNVDGILDVQGDPVTPAVFTSSIDGVNAHKWYGIAINSTSTGSVVDGALIKWARNGVRVLGTSATIANSQISRFYGTAGSQTALPDPCGICFESGAGGTVSGNVIDNITGVYSGISLDYSSPTISANTIQNNNYGIELTGNSIPVINGGNTIQNNNRGIYAEGTTGAAPNPQPVVNGNNIAGNNVHNYYAASYDSPAITTLDAINNWWGTTDPVAVANTIYDFSDNPSTSPTVDFQPLLSAAIDLIAPVITVTFPISGQLTNTVEVTIDGYLSEPAMLTIDSQAVTVQPDNSFSYGPVSLVEGVNNFLLVATDASSNVTQGALVVIRDTIPPQTPDTGLITVSAPSGGQVSVDGQAGSVEAGSVITIVNARTAETTSVTANGDGSFSILIDAETGDPLYVISEDLAANIAPWRPEEVSGANTPLAVTITNPTNGAQISDDHVHVEGAVTGPATTGITVNGVTAAIFDGKYYAYGVPIETGSNNIEVQAVTADGEVTTQTVSVDRIGDPFFIARINPSGGIVAQTMTIDITAASPGDIQSVRIDADGNGTFELSGASITYVSGTPFFDSATVAYSYTSAGVYQAIIEVTDAASTIHTYSHTVVVLPAKGLDGRVRHVYTEMLSRLKTGDTAGALKLISISVQDKYQDIFNDLAPTLSTVVDQLGELDSADIGGGLAEYDVTRQTGSGPQTYLIQILQGEDGVWRMYGM